MPIISQAFKKRVSLLAHWLTPTHFFALSVFPPLIIITNTMCLYGMWQQFVLLTKYKNSQNHLPLAVTNNSSSGNH